MRAGSAASDCVGDTLRDWWANISVHKTHYQSDSKLRKTVSAEKTELG